VKGDMSAAAWVAVVMADAEAMIAIRRENRRLEGDAVTGKERYAWTQIGLSMRLLGCDMTIYQTAE
jgi:hypothetical protein